MTITISANTGITGLQPFLPASAIINTPTGNITATDGQSTVNQLDTLKSAVAGNSNQTFSVASGTAATHASQMSQLTRKNIVINGSFSIAQRKTSGNVSAGDTITYVLDRFYIFRTTVTTLSCSQQTGDIGRYALRVQRTASDTSTTSNYLGYTIETSDAIPLAGKTLTISMYLKKGADFSSTANTLQCYIITGTGVDQGAVGALGGAWSTWAIQNAPKYLTTSAVKYTGNYTIPTGTKEIAIVFVYDGIGTAGANDWFQIEQLQLEVGPNATDFEYRSIQQELAMCQRYYEKSFPYGTVPATGVAAGRIKIQNFAASAQDSAYNINFKVTKRAAPTMVAYAQTGATATFDNIADSGGQMFNSSLSSLGVTYQHWTAEAEL